MYLSKILHCKREFFQDCQEIHRGDVGSVSIPADEPKRMQTHLRSFFILTSYQRNLHLNIQWESTLIVTPMLTRMQQQRRLQHQRHKQKR